MGVLIGVLVLGLLIAGLVSRKRSSKAWVKEERFEESGNWLDKRPGERGTWGSLDEEMAHDRHKLVRQGRAVELAEVIRQYAAGQYPELSALPEEETRKFRSFTRAQATQLVTTIEQSSKGKLLPASPVATGQPGGELKKQILDFSYHHFPALLDLDIETIRQFDAIISAWSEKVAAELAGWKK